MKTRRITIIAAIAALVFVGTSCGNKTQKTSQEEVTTVEQSANSGALEIDNLLADAQTIRVEGGSVGKFDQKCVNSIVRVTGTLKEQRVDEAYLQNWESQLKAKAAEKHGEGEAACSTEKKARGETANTPEARIADFRAKIADRKAKTGKDYLSFYFLEASSYDIQG